MSCNLVALAAEAAERQLLVRQGVTGLARYALQRVPHRLVVHVRDGAAARADDVVVQVLRSDFVERAAGDLRTPREALLDEDVEPAVHGRLVELGDRLRDLLRREMLSLRLHQRIPDQRALPGDAATAGADRRDLLERVRRVRVALHLDSSCAVQRRSIPRTFQTTAETIQVAPKSATTR